MSGLLPLPSRFALVVGWPPQQDFWRPAFCLSGNHLVQQGFGKLVGRLRKAGGLEMITQRSYLAGFFSHFFRILQGRKVPWNAIQSGMPLFEGSFLFGSFDGLPLSPDPFDIFDGLVSKNMWMPADQFICQFVANGVKIKGFALMGQLAVEDDQRRRSPSSSRISPSFSISMASINS